MHLSVREALQAMASEINCAWIYGSIAKQSETAQGDVDVMLVADASAATAATGTRAGPALRVASR